VGSGTDHTQAGRPHARASGAARVTLPGYTLARTLGSGGMGEVFEAIHLASGRNVAVKLLHEGRSTTADRARFDREGRAMQAVSHPNVCGAFDTGVTVDGALYLAMELLDGLDLGAALRRDGPLAEDEVIRIGTQAVAGLSALHDAGVLHRDLKPSNLFLHGPGRDVKIVDFGLATFAWGSEGARLTRTGEIVGTPAYMAPEQARADDATPAVDVYGLGTVLYHALTGSPPYVGESAFAVLMRMLSESAPRIEALSPHVSAGLASLVHAMMARDPAARPTLGRVSETLETLRSRRPTADMASDETQIGLTLTAIPGATAPSSRGTLKAVPLIEEQRLVTVVVASGVIDRSEIFAALRRRGAIPLLASPTRIVGLFGAGSADGDEVERASLAARDIEAYATSVEISAGRTRGRELLSTSAFADGAGARYGASTGGSPIPKAVGSDGDDSSQRPESVPEASFSITRAGRIPTPSPDAAPLADLHFERLGPVVRSGVPDLLHLPFTGRESDLGELVARASRAFEDEEPQGILLLGAPGLGKTRLIAEVVAQLSERHDDLVVWNGRGESDRRFSSWQALVGAMRSALGLDEDAGSDRIRAGLKELGSRLRLAPSLPRFLAVACGLPPEQPLSPELLAALDDPKLMRDQLIATFGDVLEALAEESPVVLVLDDVQWVDAPTLDVVGALLRRPRSRILVLLSGRPQAVEQRPELFRTPGLDHRPLKELTARASERLVEAALAAHAVPAPKAIAAALVEQAGGNPFFISAIVEHVADAFRRGGDDALDPNAFVLPLTVEGAIQARLDHLPSSDKDLLKRAAAFGVRFWERALTALGAADVTAALDRLDRAGLISKVSRREQRIPTESEHAFRQRAVREVAYGMLTEVQRRSLHAAAGHWLSHVDGVRPEEVAEHFTDAALPVDAAPFWATAAEQARRDGDLPMARVRLDAALEGTPVGATREALLLSRLSICFDLGLPGLVEQTLKELATETAPRSAAFEATLCYYRGRMAITRGQHREADEALATAEALHTGLGDLDALVRDAAGRALAALYGHLGGAREHALQAVQLAGDRPSARTVALGALTHVLIAEGALSEARAAARDCHAAAVEAHDLAKIQSSLGDLAYVAERLGRHDEARQALEAIIADSRRTGSVGYAWHNLGLVLLAQGDAVGAVKAEERALTIARETGSPRLERYTLVYLARIHLAIGDLDDAERLARDLLSAGPSLRSDIETVLAGVAVARGRYEDALRHVGAVREAQQRGDLLEIEADLDLAEIRALTALGRPEEARRATERATRALDERARRAAPDGELRDGFLNASPAHRLLSSGALLVHSG
jgi:tetratricopeptide (TPR) repeat protein